MRSLAVVFAAFVVPVVAGKRCTITAAALHFPMAFPAPPGRPGRLSRVSVDWKTFSVIFCCLRLLLLRLQFCLLFSWHFHILHVFCWQAENNLGGSHAFISIPCRISIHGGIQMAWLRDCSKQKLWKIWFNMVVKGESRGTSVGKILSKKISNSSSLSLVHDRDTELI